MALREDSGFFLAGGLRAAGFPVGAFLAAAFFAGAVVVLAFLAGTFFAAVAFLAAALAACACNLADWVSKRSSTSAMTCALRSVRRLASATATLARERTVWRRYRSRYLSRRARVRLVRATNWRSFKLRIAVVRLD